MPSEPESRWRPVALSADLPAGTTMPARLGGEPVALWRSASGLATASADRCPHRGMRLSHGFVRGEALSCIYHGWRYARSGRCLQIPAHPALQPPETIRVVTYRLTEQDGIVWVSRDMPQAAPRRFAGLLSLRSLRVAAGPVALETAAGSAADADGVLAPTDTAQGLVLLLDALDENETSMHGLVPHDFTPSQRIAASRHMEVLRWQAEEGTTP